MTRLSAARRGQAEGELACDLAPRYTAAANTAAVYVYSDNHLVDLKHTVIVDVEATTATNLHCCG